MTTLHNPQQPGMPVSAGRHDSRQDLAVLTRANHDMRSPLSVLLGVFELLEDAGSLTDHERRYLKLGARAAEELLSLADGLRLYSAMERDLVALDSRPLDLAAMAREQAQAILQPKGATVTSADSGSTVEVLGDSDHLRMALGHLIRYLAAHLPDDGSQHAAVCVRQTADEQGSVNVRVAPEDRTARPQSDGAHDEPAGEDDLGVLNGIRLIEMMGGSVVVDASKPELCITLPAA